MLTTLLFQYFLPFSVMQNFSLVVTMEEASVNGFDVIDVVTVEVEACRLSAPTMRYTGMYNIARVTLA